MEQLSIGDSEMLALHVRDMAGGAGARAAGTQPNTQPARPQQAGGGLPDAETMRLQMLGNPEMIEALNAQRPDLAAAITDPARFAAIYRQMGNQESEEQARRRQYIEDLNADPFDIEAQTRIAEMIRQERVQENLQNAIEHSPEGQLISRCQNCYSTDCRKFSGVCTCCTSMSRSTDTR